MPFRHSRCQNDRPITRIETKMKLDFKQTLRNLCKKPLDLATKKSARKKFFKALPLYTLYAFLTMLFMVAFAFAWFSKDLPTPSKIANMKPAVSTKIFDRTGQTLLYETGDQKRTIVESDQISQYLKDATVSTEDANFYRHHGVDIKAILSAVAEKVMGKTRKTRGASTITQQYVKNALLTSDRSLTRKAKEAILAIELEFMYSKDQILTNYLNQIPYGSGAGGAEAAAKTYFGKSAKEITLSEAATLAAIPQAPTYYSPYGTHIDKLVGRKNYVLEQMVKNGKITQEQADEAKKQDTTTLGINLKPRKDTILAPHFAMYVLEQAADQFGEEKIQKEGLSIITTLDYDKQKMAQDAINEWVPKLTRYKASNAALVAVDPATGQILTMVGSKDYFDTSIDGNVNVADSSRQPGSSFKPIAYATAFKKPEFSPSKILFDFQTDFGGGYVPQNYNGRFNGPVTMRTALSNSLNIPAVKVMSLAGMDNVLRTAQDLGITTLTQRDRYGLSLVLGSGEVKPVEMAGAFAVFAAGGEKHESTPFLKITDSDGKVLYDFEKDKKPGKEVLDPQIAYEISSILSDNGARSMVFGSRSALFFPNRTVAAKTGTTSDFKDAWTVGYTPSIATAVWVGNSNAAKMSSGADGSVLAAPIFHTFIEKALANVPNQDFTQPFGIQGLTVERYSNKLPSTPGLETTTDIFASWQVPTEQDDVHKIVKLCKGTNLLAPDDLSSDFVETKTIVNIHSERPDNPNWENSVRAWAESAGMTGTMPTQYCDSNNFKLYIEITSPQNSATVNGNTTISASVDTGQAVSKVEFFLDSVSIGQSTSAPYSIQYDFTSISNGSHNVSAVVSTGAGQTARAEIPVIINNEKTNTTGPVITQLVAKVEGEGKTAIISWYSDRPSTSVINYQSAADSTPLTASQSGNTTAHSIVLVGLNPDTDYTYTVTSTDEQNNSSTLTSTFHTTPN